MSDHTIIKRHSHGSGDFEPSDFSYLGEDVIFETGVLIFHPENIEIGDKVYVGNYTMLKGYFRNQMVIGEGTWIGPQCFLHSAGGLTIGSNTGIGPAVKIITSFHTDEGIRKPILHSRLAFSPVMIENDCDIGVGSVILPGVTIGRGTQVGAGSVVNRDLPPYAVAAGVPAQVIRIRV